MIDYVLAGIWTISLLKTASIGTITSITSRQSLLDSTEHVLRSIIPLSRWSGRIIGDCAPLDPNNVSGVLWIFTLHVCG